VKYRYELPHHLRERASSFVEFASGAAQCHARLKSGSIVSGLLICGGVAIGAMKNEVELPFSVSEVDEIFQTADDESPSQRGGWQFFDEWA
jgi:hypothetical protein